MASAASLPNASSASLAGEATASAAASVRSVCTGPRVTVRFRLPYPTRWGENLLVCGSEELGGWDAKRGLWMSCQHEDDVLVWQARRRLAARARVNV